MVNLIGWMELPPPIPLEEYVTFRSKCVQSLLRLMNCRLCGLFEVKAAVDVGWDAAHA